MVVISCTSTPGSTTQFPRSRLFSEIEYLTLCQTRSSGLYEQGQQQAGNLKKRLDHRPTISQRPLRTITTSEGWCACDRTHSAAHSATDKMVEHKPTLMSIAKELRLEIYDVLFHHCYSGLNTSTNT